MKIIFMGTPTIGQKVLQALIDLNNEIVGVVCQPDRLFNKKKQIIFSPVKELAIKNNFLILQPNNVNDIYDKINELKPDIIITCAYGQFISDKILNIPKYGSYNIHASLLPELRGGAPIHWAIINGQTQTGITIMKMVKKMDAGNYFYQAKCNIEQNDTYDSLYNKLSQLAYDSLINNWDKLINQKFKEMVQNESQATYGYNIKKEDTIINFNLNANKILNLIRGLYSKPMALWIYNDLSIKVTHAFISNQKSNLKPGTITKIDKSGIYIATKDYDIVFDEIILPNKKPLKVSQIINGKNIFI